MTKKPRYSPQRAAILNILNRDGGHLEAPEIHKRVRKIHPKVSLATVYRNLSQLETLKLISSIKNDANIMFFEIYREPHHHFVCEKCGQITNLEYPTINICTSCISPHSNFKIRKVATTLHGVCEYCNTRRVARGLIKPHGIKHC